MAQMVPDEKLEAKIRTSKDIDDKSVKSKSVKKPPGIKFIEGATDILIIAPHGVNVPGVKNDDNRTDILASAIAKKLKCSALINDSIKRTKRNYNSITEATKDKAFIKNIRSVLAADGPTLVIWLHGMKEKRSLEESEQLGLRGALDCVVGYGQPNRHSAQKDTVNTLVELMNDHCIAGLPTADSGYLRGWDTDNMNQWFRQQNEYNDLNKVQSIQLEIKEDGFRDSGESARKTGKIIAEALSDLVRPHEQDTKPPNEKQKQPTEVKAIELAEKVKPNVDESNRVETSDDTQLAGGRPYQVKMRKIAELRPHPLNREIYGDPNPDDGLKISIQKNGILTPLIISGNGTIVSGHRRFSGAKECGIEEVPVIIMPPCDDLDIEETLIVANTQRQKTKEQIAREYEKLKIIEGEKSKIRMSLAGGDRKSEKYKKSHAQNSAAPISKGDSRENAAARFR